MWSALGPPRPPVYTPVCLPPPPLPPPAPEGVVGRSRGRHCWGMGGRRQVEAASGPREGHYCSYYTAQGPLKGPLEHVVGPPGTLKGPVGIPSVGGTLGHTIGPPGQDAEEEDEEVTFSSNNREHNVSFRAWRTHPSSAPSTHNWCPSSLGALVSRRAQESTTTPTG